MVSRPRHPNKEIESAVAYAESRGWVYVRAGSHGWGVLHCPHRARDGCRRTVYSTPRVPIDHAELIRRSVDRCHHRTGE